MIRKSFVKFKLNISRSNVFGKIFLIVNVKLIPHHTTKTEKENYDRQHFHLQVSIYQLIQYEHSFYFHDDFD